MSALCLCHPQGKQLDSLALSRPRNPLTGDPTSALINVPWGLSLQGELH
jgi:hypothetical protein